MSKGLHGFVYISILLFFLQHNFALSYAQRYKRSKEIRDVEALSIEKLRAGKWYVIQVHPGESSGQYITKDGHKKSEGPTGSSYTRYVGYWEILQRLDGHKDRLDGGKYHWWKPSHASGGSMEYKTFLSGGLILSELDHDKVTKRPSWRKPKNIRKLEKQFLNMVSLPDHIQKKKTLYFENHFTPYFLIPDGWGSVVVDAIDVLSQDQKMATKKPTLQEIKQTDNPLIACKLFQKLIETGNVSLSDYKEIVPDQIGFQGQFYTYLFFRNAYEYDSVRGQIMNYLKQSNKKSTYINAAISMFMMLEHDRNILVSDQKTKVSTKEFFRWLFNQEKEFSIKNPVVRDILKQYKAQFSRIFKSTSNRSGD